MFEGWCNRGKGDQIGVMSDGFHGNPGPERKTGDMAGKIRMSLPQLLCGSQCIFDLTLPIVISSRAQPDAAKVETQHLTTQTKESFCNCEDHLVVHGSLELRVRVAHDHQGLGVY